MPTKPLLRLNFTLLISAATLAVVAVLVVAWAREAAIQHSSVTEIKRLGGSVYYDDGPWFLPGGVTVALGEWLGDDYVRAVVVVCPDENRLADSMPQLKRLRHLRMVYFWAITSGETIDLIKASLPGVELSAKMMR
ncbi:hypothetical protein [Botrimarina colliarenosi]|uniref:hypothetical protein n=1 Tax=Botrimarina colliarenosi TaxID=2528001 RepID=UPI0011B72522|nr:hypothetical protein [Botrimarina colliarenosi]